MPNTSHISLAIKGMNHDMHSFNLDEQSYPFAYNAVIEDFWKGNSSFLANEPSTRCSVEFPIDYQVVGFKEILEQNRTIYFLHNPTTGVSQIGEVRYKEFIDRTDTIKESNCEGCPSYSGEEITPLEKQEEICYNTYEIILSSSCLNFDINYPVSIEYRLTNCSLNLYFTDKINERRFIYFDYENNDFSKNLVLQDRFKIENGYIDDECKLPIYLNELDCEKIKVHPNYKRACPKFKGFVNGGNLKEGTYQILVALADSYGNPMSSYFPSTQIIPLFENQITLNTNNPTNKALHIEVENLQTNGLFKYYNIIIAQTIDQFTEFIHVATLPITQKSYVYTGFEKTSKRLDPTEVLFERPFYKNAKSVTKSNNYLFYIDVTEYPILNLQQVANKVKLYWETIAIKEDAYNDPENTFLYRTYQRDEVYSFGIIFEFANGRETCAFHIPGREIESDDLTLVIDSEDDLKIYDENCYKVVSCNRSTHPTQSFKWEVYNTASVLDAPHEYTENCNDIKTWEYGKFSYHESTERYPNEPEIWGDLCGTCIRHHKFPDSSITHIHDSLPSTFKYGDNNYIFPIGVKVDDSSIRNAIQNAVIEQLITQEDADSIIGYRIVRGNRVGNKSVVAKGLLYNTGLDNKASTETSRLNIFPTYPYNDVRPFDALLNEVYYTYRAFNLTDTIEGSYYTFHSPETHFVNTSLGNIIKLETEEYGYTESVFTLSDCQAKYSFVSSFAYVLSFGLGLAAALSATGEKECKTLIKKADRIDSHPVFVSGSTVPGVDPLLTWMNNASLIPDASGNRQGVNQNNASYTTYNPETGLPMPPVPIPNTYAEERITTCKGEAYQLFVSYPALASLFGGLNIAVQRAILGITEMNKILDTIKSLIPNTNLTAQYNSVGKYNNYLPVPQGNKIAPLEYSYLKPVITNVDFTNPRRTITVNNWNRESTVLLATKKFPNTTIQDDSKVSIREQTGSSTSSVNSILDKTFNKTISSYYVSIKNNIYNQYGTICNIEYLETDGCSKNLDTPSPAIFGGDTYISRFALKRKMPLFIQTRCDMPDNSDVLYEELSNVGTAKYFFNTPEPLLARITGSGSSDFDIISLLTDLTNENTYQYDIKENKLFYQKGLITLFHYGIPYFLVESDINLNFRTGQNMKDKDFYPHNKNLKQWLEEGNVPIETDNTYYYNNTYSKQNRESTICSSCIITPKDLICDSTNYNRLIYSDPSTSENKDDNWLTFKANNYYDFDLTKGKLISADGIEDDKVLVRLERSTQIFNAYDTIQASSTNIQVGTGGMFSSRPKDIAVTDLGYAGTQHRDILHTEFGHIWADAERGQVFKLGLGGSGIEELSNKGMRSWFKENLPFHIKNAFPSIDIDNNLNGIGLHYGYDRRFSRFLLTKLDYKVLDPSIRYIDGYFYKGINKVELWNPKYFCNKSWTISYSFLTGTWTSFHSYTPNFYIEHINTFDSSIQKLEVNSGQLSKKQKIYTHNASNKSYQVIYGKLEPFIVDVVTKPSLTNNTLQGVEYMLEAWRYHNEYDYAIINNKTFNKAIIYNNNQTSGLLNLNVSNPNDFSETFKYPKVTDTGLDILVHNSENRWRFNDFYNIATKNNSNVPIYLNNCNNVLFEINPKAVTYNINDLDKELLRGLNKVRYIQDSDSNYKFIFIFSQHNQRQSFR